MTMGTGGDRAADGPVVLVLSAGLAGGVALVSRALRRRGLRCVLVSEAEDDPNAAVCDGHVVADWDRTPAQAAEALAAALDAAGLKPRAAVNFVESLIRQRAAILGRLGLPDPAAGLASLTDKAAVRRAADEAGVFPLYWRSGTPGELADARPTQYPAVLKPAVVSGASCDVRLIRDAADLAATAALLSARHADRRFLLEEFLEGTEFSVDALVSDGRVEAMLAADKPDHDDERLRDRGLRASPPVRVPAPAIERFVGDLQVLVTHLGLSGAWLHVEGRLGPDGRVGLIEINPRPGGGLHPAAIRYRCGLDPIEASLALALGEAVPPRAGGHPGLLAMVPVEAGALGVVECRTSAADLRRIDGVLDAYVIEGYRVTSLGKENFFAGVMVGGRNEEELREHAARASAALAFRVVPDGPDLTGRASSAGRASGAGPERSVSRG